MATGGVVGPPKLAVGAFLRRWLRDYPRVNVRPGTPEGCQTTIEAHLRSEAWGHNAFLSCNRRNCSSTLLTTVRWGSLRHLLSYTLIACSAKHFSCSQERVCRSKRRASASPPRLQRGKVVTLGLTVSDSSLRSHTAAITIRSCAWLSYKSDSDLK